VAGESGVDRSGRFADDPGAGGGCCKRPASGRYGIDAFVISTYARVARTAGVSHDDGGPFRTAEGGSGSDLFEPHFRRLRRWTPPSLAGLSAAQGVIAGLDCLRYHIGECLNSKLSSRIKRTDSSRRPFRKSTSQRWLRAKYW